MFYSEQLLAKNGPLGRIWLASNVERKLTKNHVLTSDLSSSVNTIVNETQAPIALRMSAQLMLGVVRIYGRKARYLLDDSNEALVKIRMTFKNNTNHDLVDRVGTTIELNLPETYTLDDLFPPLDFGFGPVPSRPSATPERTLTFDDDWASSLNPQTQSIHDSARSDRHAPIHDDPLNLDFGDSVGLGDTSVSIQVGRGAEDARPDESTALAIYDDDDVLNIDLGEDVPMPDTRRDLSALPQIEDELAAVQLGEDQRTERAQSVLSEADPEIMQELDRTFAQQEVEEQVARQAPSRRQRPLEPDLQTEIRSSEFKAFAEDTSKITRPLTLLPQDPELMALLNMQTSGAFVTNTMNDMHPYMAPEIQGLLAFDVVRRAGQKRKRDSGVADVHSEDEHSDKSPRLDRSELQGGDEQVVMDDDEGIAVPEQSPPRASSAIPDVHEPIDTDHPALGDVIQGEDEEGIYAQADDFDQTTMPLVHPADSGPVSDGTKRAVHEFRRIFGDQPTSNSPSRKTVLLQDIVPEQTTSKADATKMFFETLVLATKDAIKVEQASDQIGMPIRIRAKRGLWGQWAEQTQTQELAVES